MFWSPSSAIENSSTALSKIGYHPHYLQKCNNELLLPPSPLETGQLLRHSGPTCTRQCNTILSGHLNQFWESSKAPHTVQHWGLQHYLITILGPHWSGAVPCWHKEAVPKLSPAGSSSSRPCCLAQLQPYKHTATVRSQPGHTQQKPLTPISN